MSSRYIFKDPIFHSGNEKLKGLFLERTHKSSLGIFRILSGTCKVLDEFSNKNYVLRTNYFQLPFLNNRTIKQQIISDLFPEEVKIFDVANYFSEFHRNRDFYDPIEIEVINCVLARLNNRYLESFLFLYRILEGVSYSIPLIYTSRSKDFKKTFRSLQKYVGKSGADSEIKFFRTFINEVFNLEPFYSTSIDIKFDVLEFEELRSKYFKIYKDKIDDKYIENEIEDEELNVSFIGFFDFLIELRNRYFHFLQGTWQNNLATSDIIYPDQFFKPIIDLGINWIAVIWFEVLKFDFQN
ncbi:hypothetical protein KKI24_24295 [bacterium]|nr:hypothetical protein [bacterium]